MNKYPIWWNNTITIYNKSIDISNNEITWYRQVVNNCFRADTYVRNITDKQVADGNKLIIRIPQSSSYLPHGTWNASASTVKQYNFTLQQGDIIIFGQVNDVIDEYPATTPVTTLTSSELIAKYKKSGDCLTIETFQDNTGDARGIPHYRIIGV